MLEALSNNIFDVTSEDFLKDRFDCSSVCSTIVKGRNRKLNIKFVHLIGHSKLSNLYDFPYFPSLEYRVDIRVFLTGKNFPFPKIIHYFKL